MPAVLFIWLAPHINAAVAPLRVKPGVHVAKTVLPNNVVVTAPSVPLAGACGTWQSTAEGKNESDEKKSYDCH